MELREEEQMKHYLGLLCTWGFICSLPGKGEKRSEQIAKRMKKIESKRLFRDSWKLFVAVAGTRRPHMCYFKMCTLQMRKGLSSSWANYKRTGPKPHQYHQGRAVQSGTGCWRDNCSTWSANAQWRNCLTSLNTHLCVFGDSFFFFFTFSFRTR